MKKIRTPWCRTYHLNQLFIGVGLAMAIADSCGRKLVLSDNAIRMGD
jgi:hypothetical protein